MGAGVPYCGQERVHHKHLVGNNYVCDSFVVMFVFVFVFQHPIFQHNHLIIWQDSEGLHQSWNQLVDSLGVEDKGEDVTKDPAEGLLQFGNVDAVGYC